MCLLSCFLGYDMKYCFYCNGSQDVETWYKMEVKLMVMRRLEFKSDQVGKVFDRLMLDSHRCNLECNTYSNAMILQTIMYETYTWILGKSTNIYANFTFMQSDLCNSRLGKHLNCGYSHYGSRTSTSRVIREVNSEAMDQGLFRVQATVAAFG